MRSVKILILLLASSGVALAQAPTISNITTTPQMAGIVHVKWETSALASSQVFYDTVTRPSDTDGSLYAFASSVDSSADVTHHLRLQAYLTPNTTYFYKLKSGNGGGTTYSSESTFTTAANGVRTSDLLIIRVNFPDDLASLPNDASINATMTTISGEIDTHSFGQSTITWDIVPGTVTALHASSFYTALESVSNTHRAEQLAVDISAAVSGSFDTSDYFAYVIWVPSLYDWQNSGFISGVNGLSHMHVDTFAAYYLIHANLLISGLGAAQRANGWVSNDATVFGSAGAPNASGIGDAYDMLGVESSLLNLNIKHKSGAGWLLPANIQTVTTNGVYRVYAHDTETTLNGSRIYGIRMAGYLGTEYWIEFRQTSPSPNGVLINWGGLMLLDMVPGGSIEDSHLTSGNTFTDPDGRTVTFTSTGGTTPSYVDLTIGGLAAPSFVTCKWHTTPACN